MNKLLQKLSAVALGVMAIAGSVFADCPDFIEQGFYSGPNFYTWRLQFTDYSYDEIADQTTICYNLSDVTPDGDGTRMISHFVVGLPCDELREGFVSATYNGAPVDATVGPDPTTGVLGVKIDSANPGEYCFTFSGEYELGCVTAALKNGSATAPIQQEIVGLVCCDGDCGGGGGGQSTLSGVKWYDANANGIKDNGELGIEGWQILVCVDIDGEGGEDPTCTVIETGPDGVYTVNGQVGWTYDISERMPNETDWMQSGLLDGDNNVILSFSGEFLSTPTTGLDFGNLCLGAGGGRTLGFWSNRNGQALVDPADLQALRDLNLYNANGTEFNPDNYAALRSFLLNATAVNMKNMLSAQLAAMVLNVREGFVSGDSIVYAPGCGDFGAGSGFITIGNLITKANDALLNLDADADRAMLECLKDALDDANNNLNFVQATACPFTFPPYEG